MTNDYERYNFWMVELKKSTNDKKLKEKQQPLKEEVIESKNPIIKEKIGNK